MKIKNLVNPIQLFACCLAIPHAIAQNTAASEEVLQKAGINASITSNSDQSEKTVASGEESEVSARLDCMHDFNRDKGASQPCTSITGLRYKVTKQLDRSITSRLRIDPFATLDAGRAHLPLREHLPMITDSQLFIIDDYGVTWTPRPNLDLALESYAGAVKMPHVTDLGFENPFDNPGWLQTALTITYNLEALSKARVRFALGNGEGENGENLDPQQYFGLELDANVVQGIHFKLGVSQDANSLGSIQYEWLSNRYNNECGFSFAQNKARLGYRTLRIGTALTIDENFAAIPGLKLAFSGQRSNATDLDKSRTGYLVAEDFAACQQIDLNYLFVETAPGQEANTVENTILGMSLGMKLLDQYLIAGSYSARTIDTGKVQLFENCNSFEGGKCITEASQRQLFNKVNEDALTLGGSVKLAAGLQLTLEYARLNLDRKYAKVYYSNKGGKPSDTREIFNARLAYQWR